MENVFARANSKRKSVSGERESLPKEVNPACGIDEDSRRCWGQVIAKQVRTIPITGLPLGRNGKRIASSNLPKMPERLGDQLPSHVCMCALRDQRKAIFVQHDGPEACPVHASLAELLQDSNGCFGVQCFVLTTQNRPRVRLNEPEDEGGHVSFALL